MRSVVWLARSARYALFWSAPSSQAKTRRSCYRSHAFRRGSKRPPEHCSCRPSVHGRYCCAASGDTRDRSSRPEPQHAYKTACGSRIDEKLRRLRLEQLHRSKPHGVVSCPDATRAECQGAQSQAKGRGSGTSPLMTKRQCNLPGHHTSTVLQLYCNHHKPGRSQSRALGALAWALAVHCGMMHCGRFVCMALCLM